MRWSLNIVLAMVFSVGSVASALPAPTCPERAFELMKCSSAKLGTLWASFGHVTSSSQPEARFFPTEIILFSGTNVHRQVFPSWREALDYPLEIAGGRARLEVQTDWNGGRQKNLLQLMQMDPRDRHAFSGNWTRTEADGTEIMDLVACSLD